MESKKEKRRGDSLPYGRDSTPDPLKPFRFIFHRCKIYRDLFVIVAYLTSD